MKNICQDCYKRKTEYLTMAGVFAALITLMTAYICHVPMGANGGYVHFGDAFVFLAAVLLPRNYALAAAAIGGGLADLLTAPMWVPATIVIKMLIVLPFTPYRKEIINKRNVISIAIAYLISGVGYYLAERFMFEQGAVFAVTMAQIALQTVGSGVIFVLFGLALDRYGIKKRYDTKRNRV